MSVSCLHSTCCWLETVFRNSSTHSLLTEYWKAQTKITITDPALRPVILSVDTKTCKSFQNLELVSKLSFSDTFRGWSSRKSKMIPDKFWICVALNEFYWYRESLNWNVLSSCQAGCWLQTDFLPEFNPSSLSSQQTIKPKQLSLKLALIILLKV